MALRSNLWNDLRYAARRLQASPGFTAAAVLTIALGVGVNTGIFSVLNGVALRELPAPAADELVSIHQIHDEATRRQRLGFVWTSNFSTSEYRDYRDSTQTLSGIMGYSPQATVTLGSDTPQEIVGTLVTCNYFDVLRQAPALGPGFASDCDAPGALPTVVLGHDLWTTAFGADPAVISREVLLNREAFTVVGVAPEGMRGVDMVAVSWFAPISAQPSLLLPGSDLYRNDEASWLTLVGRKAGGTTLDRVRAELDIIAARIDRQQPPRETRLDIERARPLSAPEARRQSLPTAAVIMAAFGLVLLIACANVANLLLARATVRTHEMAVRMSLGASRARVVQQLLAESVSIALLAGVLGLVLAVWASQSLVALLASAQSQPLTVDAVFDVRVLSFGFVVTLASGVLSGLVPALQSSKPELHTATKVGGTGAAHPAGRRLQRILLGMQVAVCMVLMISAGLLLRGLHAMQTVEPGFEYENVAIASLDFSRSGYAARDAARAAALQRDLVERVGSRPGIDAVARVRDTPLRQSRGGVTVSVPGRSQPLRLRFNLVSPGYFSLMRIPIVRGRTFTASELADGPGAAIVTEATARRLWPDRDAVGQSFTVSSGPRAASGAARAYRVVGIARDAQITDIGEIPADYVYLPAGPESLLQLVARSRIGFAAAAADLRAAAAELDPALIVRVDPLEANLDLYRRTARLVSTLSLSLGALALVLASVGVYGVVAFAVNRRVREIGIRMALGANARSVLALVLKRTMWPVVVGALFGIIVSAAVSGVLSGVLFGVSRVDPLGMGGAALFVIGVAVTAAVLAARPATRSDPRVSLRHE